MSAELLAAWRRIRMAVGLMLFAFGLWQILPVVAPAIVQQSAPGRLVEVYADELADGMRQPRVLFEYRVEDAEQVTIGLGHDLAGATGELIDLPQLDAQAMAALQARIEAAGGAEKLSCRVFLGGGPPRIYCPLLAGDRRRWQLGVVCVAIPVILFLSGLLHRGLRVRREPSARARVHPSGGIAS